MHTVSGDAGVCVVVDVARTPARTPCRATRGVRGGGRSSYARMHTPGALGGGQAGRGGGGGGGGGVPGRRRRAGGGGGGGRGGRGGGGGDQVGERAASKERSELVTASWWTSTAMTLVPTRRADAGIVKVRGLLSLVLPR